jgi:hypothetical protein
MHESMTQMGGPVDVMLSYCYYVVKKLWKQC